MKPLGHRQHLNKPGSALWRRPAPPAKAQVVNQLKSEMCEISFDGIKLLILNWDITLMQHSKSYKNKK